LIWRVKSIIIISIYNLTNIVFATLDLC
jgi:hypothetical protein